MARSNDKELLQCFAFAYYAKHKHQLYSEKHENGWYEVFNRHVTSQNIVIPLASGNYALKEGDAITSEVANKINKSGMEFPPSFIRKLNEGECATHMEQEYGRYLRKSFDFRFMVKKFSNKLLKNDSGKFSIQVKPKVKIAYKVAESFVTNSDLFDDLSGYMFLDQDDEFTLTIKDKSLKKLKAVFKLSGNHELLSPVDMFCVRAKAKDEVQKDFEKYLVDASEENILSNVAYGKEGRNTYRSITRKYFHSRDLIPISLKFPKTIAGTKNLKIVGSTSATAGLKSFIDPYGKLIGELLNSDTDIEKLISKAITINFSEFRIQSDLLSWEYPVTFNYKEIVDSETREPLYHTNLKFELLSWASAGFNGRWIIGGQKTTWVSGMGVGTSEQVLFRYPEYRSILDNLIQIRRKVFEKMAPTKTIKSNLLSQHTSALSVLSERHILTDAKMKAVDTFFASTGSAKLAETYRFTVIKELTKHMKTRLTSSSTNLKSHYVASQLAYFLFLAESKNSLFLKKRIFLSIFGMLTKSGYKIFEKDGGKTEMKEYIRRMFEKNGVQVEAHFTTAPYILLS